MTMYFLDLNSVLFGIRMDYRLQKKFQTLQGITFTLFVLWVFEYEGKIHTIKRNIYYLKVLFFITSFRNKNKF